MRFGIVILPDQPWSVAGQRWRQAEAYGFDHGWTYDHLGWRDLVDGPWFDSMATLTAAATVTTTMRLGTLVASPNFRHPAHFAREITTLDDVSGGRLSVGMGAGTADFDATVLGMATLLPRQRADRFEEFVGLLDILLTQGRATWSGSYYTVAGARSDPGCVQQPRVPFLVAANGPRGMRIAARHGQGWVTTGPRSDDLDDWWSGVAECSARFAEIMTTAGGREISRMLHLDSAPVFSLSSVAAFTDAVGRATELGFTDVITHWPRESSWYAGKEAVLEAVATDVLPRFRTSPGAGFDPAD